MPMSVGASASQTSHAQSSRSSASPKPNVKPSSSGSPHSSTALKGTNSTAVKPAANHYSGKGSHIDTQA